MLRIYNSLSREKQRFTPIEAGKVRMYVCGITVYDYCHIGHARMLVVFDMVYRYLRAQGYAVTYVRNITDIDDKIIRRAQENGEAYTALTARFIAAMHADAEALQMLKPDYEPKATENIPAILAMIETLIKKGHAYLATSGDVYYAVNSFQSYGCLSGKKREDLRAGARVEVAEQKNDPLDFVLWKAGKPGEPTWDSPWGPGRPGWHIECSAMSSALLGAHFDIHGGGQDLQFPHHENEIAQSEACHGEKFVNYWLHNGFVRINEEKMSKSLGNFFTIRDVLQHYKGEELRYLLLSSHYRSPLNYSETQLETAKAALTRLYTALRDLSSATPDATVGREYRERFINAMNDDFNTPEALAVLFDIAHVINREKERQTTQAAKLGAVLRELAGILGFLNHDPEAYLQASGNSALGDAAIEAMLAERTAARAARDWATSDRIRDQLAEQGVILEDSADGTRWRRA